MHFFNLLINTFLLFSLLAIQSFALASASDNNGSLSYNHQNTSTKIIFDLNENIKSTSEEKADNENSEDNFEELKLALIQQSLKKILNLKEITSYDLAIKLELLFSSVPTSPPNFC